MNVSLILTRAVHFGACLLFFGTLVFDRYAAARLARQQNAITDYWKTCLSVISWILLPIILVSGVAWFALVAMAMSGQPLNADILKIVWAQTQFGSVTKIRLLFLFVAAVLACFQKSLPSVQQLATWVQVLATGCLLGSLAWAGHGQEDSRWHLPADVIHLLAAGVWPAGLLPLWLLLRKARRIAQPQDWPSMALLVSRFSAISVITVLLLALSGSVNALYLVGTFPNLIEQPYGRWLLAKIIFFCIALAVAAMNLLRLKPRLMAERLAPEKATAIAAQLQSNVQFELVLGSGIVAVVAILGILPPASH
ncbi:MAG TPA: CopD family protein [Alphaproteobacteria bacterium]|nr:CopD family protein [Alphaproteobacteria bacterium]